jgi:hypothetical protein
MAMNINSKGENAILFSETMIDHVLIHAFDLQKAENESDAKPVTESTITVLKILELTDKHSAAFSCSYGKVQAPVACPFLFRSSLLYKLNIISIFCTSRVIAW